MAITYKEYTVQAGDHLMAIALKYLGSKARYKEIRDAEGNPLTSETLHPGDVLRIPVETESPQTYFEYTVQAGDHLMAIALKYLGSKARYKEIRDAEGNPLASETLHPGDVLRIPTGTAAPQTYFEYTVKAGDHLMAIALKYLGSKARYKEIRDAKGNLLTSDTLHPGDVLRIPKQ